MMDAMALSEPLHDFLRALASDTRQRILFLFMARMSMTVGQVAEAVAVSPSTASEHLAVLKRAGILRSQRMGKEVVYQPQRSAMLARANELLTYLSMCCPPDEPPDPA